MDRYQAYIDVNCVEAIAICSLECGLLKVLVENDRANAISRLISPTLKELYLSYILGDYEC